MKDVITTACILWILLPTFSLQAKQSTKYAKATANILLEEEINIENADSLFWFQVIQKGMDTLDVLKAVDKRIILNHSGKIMLSLSKLDSALHFFERAELLYHTDHLDKAKLYMNMAEVYYMQNMYKTTSANLFKALKIYETHQDNAGTANCLSFIGYVLLDTEDYQASIEYFQRAAEIQEKENMVKELADTYGAMSRAYIFVDSLEQGMTVINQAINYYKQITPYPFDLYKAYNDKGNLLKYLERYDSAAYYYRQLLDYVQKVDNKVGILIANGNLSHVYFLNEDYEKALPYALKAIELSHETGETRNLWENNLHAANIYEKLGNFEKALQYHHAFSDKREDFYEQSYDNLKSEYQVKYETQKKDKEIQMQQAQIAITQKIQMLTNGILALLLLGLGLLFWFYQNNRKKNALLEVKNQENELLLKEIHHRVKNNLERISSLLYLQARTIEDPNALEAIRESQNRVESMSLIHKKLYMGKNLAAIDMEDYLKNLGDQILESFAQDESQVQLHYDIAHLSLDVDTAIPLGLIVNELLTNAIKYAFPNKQKGEITISLKNQNRQLQLQIADNGVGTNIDSSSQEAKSTGFGTQLIQLLTSQLSGKMERLPGKGTNILLKFNHYKLA